MSAGVSMCPVEVSIDSHRMLIIASDGMDIEPIEAGTYISIWITDIIDQYSGIRYRGICNEIQHKV